MRWIVAAVLLYYTYGQLGAAWEDWHWRVNNARYYLGAGIVTGICFLSVLFRWGM